MCFTDLQHGWATGYDNVKNESVVLRTADGGALWKTACPSDGGAYSANAMTMTPGGDLWVAGSEGWDGALIARSADKGAAWEYAAAPTLEYLLGIEALTDKVVYAAGTGGALVRTGNGGKTWREVASAPQGDLLGMRFASATEGWALANDRVTVAGTVLHTTDDGATWTSTTGDVVGPRTRVFAATVRRGTQPSLAYVVNDAPAASACRVSVRVRDSRGRLVWSKDLGWRQQGGRHFSFTCRLATGTYWMKALATDRAGNTQSHIKRGKLIVR